MVCALAGTVPLDYDPIKLAKLAVWAGSREDAIPRMRRAIGEYRSFRHSHQSRFLRSHSRGLGIRRSASWTPASSSASSRAFPRRLAEPSPRITSLAAAAVEEQAGRSVSTGLNGSPGNASLSSPWLLSGREQVQR